MLITAAPCALLWPAAMVVWGPGYVSSNHRHHSVQLVMALQGKLRIRSRPEDKWQPCGAALVGPDAPHEVDATDGTVLIAFVDPLSDLGATLLAKIDPPITPILDSTVASWRKTLGDPASLTSARVEPWVRKDLLAGRRSPHIHPRVRRALQTIRDELATKHRFSLKQLSQIAGLSESRFMHVFTESVGVPLRPYILWLKLQRGCGEMMQGASVTRAAHRAGFSDAAHFTRTVRRMMGTTPRDLVRRQPETKAAFVGSSR